MQTDSEIEQESPLYFRFILLQFFTETILLELQIGIAAKIQNNENLC